MVFIISLINKKEHAIKDKSNTFMEEKVKVQELTLNKTLSIFPQPRKRRNSQFLDVIGVY